MYFLDCSFKLFKLNFNNSIDKILFVIQLFSFVTNITVICLAGFINYKQFLKKFQEQKESIFISENMNKSPGRFDQLFITFFIFQN